MPFCLFFGFFGIRMLILIAKFECILWLQNLLQAIWLHSAVATRHLPKRKRDGEKARERELSSHKQLFPHPRRAWSRSTHATPHRNEKSRQTPRTKANESIKIFSLLPLSFDSLRSPVRLFKVFPPQPKFRVRSSYKTLFFFRFYSL